jgi:hypothetical protein
MQRLTVSANLPDQLVLKTLDEQIKNSQELLRQEILAIHGAFEEAVESYRQIDDLIPEKT